MYPEKAKREEKPKRRSRPKHTFTRFSLALLFLVPSLMFMLRRFNHEQYIDMALLTVMITLAVYLAYQIVTMFLAAVFRMPAEVQENSDLSHESGNH